MCSNLINSEIKVDIGQIHISNCNMILIHICDVRHITNLLSEVIYEQIHIVYCHITFILINKVHITIHYQKRSGNLEYSHL